MDLIQKTEWIPMGETCYYMTQDGCRIGLVKVELLCNEIQVLILLSVLVYVCRTVVGFPSKCIMNINPIFRNFAKENAKLRAVPSSAIM